MTKQTVRAYIIRAASYGIVFGIVMALMQIVFGFLFPDESAPERVAITIAVQSLIFGLVMAALPLRSFRGIRRPELSTVQNIQMESAAYHHGIQGWLVLTGEKLAFKANASPDAEVSIPLPSIAGAEMRKFFGFVPTGIHVLQGGDASQTFLVEKPEEWLQKLASVHT